MKVRLTLDVSPGMRYVIARYFGVAATEARDKVRARASRAQVRRFAQAALRASVREQAEQLRKRQRTTARRLMDRDAGGPPDAEELAPPVEQQRSIPW